jgi:micrococcal nuclease
VECFGKAASSYTTDALEGRRVTLEFDVERSDQYDRTLAYVWLGRQLFNEEILRAGYAQVATYPPNVRYVERFLAAQRVARAGDKGLWSECGEGEEALGRVDKPKGLVTNGNCDPSYSGACVPAYPPDVDCHDIRATDFRSKGSDPHGFDGDGDGIACESY